MYCYLGIVAQDDQIAGHIVPSYILCQSHGTAATRSGWRVVRQDDTNKGLRNMNKVLVTELYGHDDMIDYLCAYRTRDHMHNDDRYSHAATKKYYPKGAQFWFECTIHGDPDGSAIFICRIPIMNQRKTDDGFQRLKESRAQISPLKTRLAREPTMIEDALICIKPHLEQRRR